MVPVTGYSCRPSRVSGAILPPHTINSKVNIFNDLGNQGSHAHSQLLHLRKAGRSISSLRSLQTYVLFPLCLENRQPFLRVIPQATVDLEGLFVGISMHVVFRMESYMNLLFMLLMISGIRDGPIYSPLLLLFRPPLIPLHLPNCSIRTSPPLPRSSRHQVQALHRPVLFHLRQISHLSPLRR